MRPPPVRHLLQPPSPRQCAPTSDITPAAATATAAAPTTSTAATSSAVFKCGSLPVISALPVAAGPDADIPPVLASRTPPSPCDNGHHPHFAVPVPPPSCASAAIAPPAEVDWAGGSDASQAIPQQPWPPEATEPPPAATTSLSSQRASPVSTILTASTDEASCSPATITVVSQRYSATPLPPPYLDFQVRPFHHRPCFVCFHPPALLTCTCIRPPRHALVLCAACRLGARLPTAHPHPHCRLGLRRQHWRDRHHRPRQRGQRWCRSSGTGARTVMYTSAQHNDCRGDGESPRRRRRSPPIEGRHPPRTSAAHADRSRKPPRSRRGGGGECHGIHIAKDALIWLLLLAPPLPPASTSASCGGGRAGHGGRCCSS